MGMKFGLEKCTEATFFKGRLKKSTSIELGNSMKIRELEQEEVYKYRGVNESTGNTACHHERQKKKIMLQNSTSYP